MTLEDIFSKCEAIHNSKVQDYTSDAVLNSHENFIRSAEIGSWFNDPADKPYVILIGTKLARLGALLSSKRAPNNESIEDTFVDLVNYCALWAERRTEIVTHSEAGKYIQVDVKEYIKNPHDLAYYCQCVVCSRKREEDIKNEADNRTAT